MCPDYEGTLGVWGSRWSSPRRQGRLTGGKATVFCQEGCAPPPQKENTREREKGVTLWSAGPRGQRGHLPALPGCLQGRMDTPVPTSEAPRPPVPEMWGCGAEASAFLPALVRDAPWAMACALAPPAPRRRVFPCP